MRNNLKQWKLCSSYKIILKSQFSASDGIEVQDTRHEPIAKAFNEPDPSGGSTWRVVCEKNSQRQLAVLTADGHLSFSSDIALPLKLLLICTLSRAVVTRTSPSCFPFFR